MGLMEPLNLFYLSMGLTNVNSYHVLMAELQNLSFNGTGQGERTPCLSKTDSEFAAMYKEIRHEYRRHCICRPSKQTFCIRQVVSQCRTSARKAKGVIQGVDTQTLAVPTCQDNKQQNICLHQFSFFSNSSDTST